jgi:N-acetylmuramoyl-L-alanine amidase
MEKRVDLLPMNKYSRPGLAMQEVKYIFMHWVANPKTTAQQNRDFFASREDGTKGFGSGHYIIDSNEVIKCIPEEEIAISVGTANGITDWAWHEFGDGRHQGYSEPHFWGIAVELCHNDWEGSFTPETWKNAVELCALICERYDLYPHRSIITHNMVVGWKNCPKWFVDHPAELQRFKDQVAQRLDFSRGE